jgi:hypothetical protein
MITAKEHVIAVLKEIPDDCTMGDLLYHLYVSYRVGSGLKDIEEGRVVPQAQAEERYRKWKAGRSSGRNQRSEI